VHNDVKSDDWWLVIRPPRIVVIFCRAILLVDSLHSTLQATLTDGNQTHHIVKKVNGVGSGTILDRPWWAFDEFNITVVQANKPEDKDLFCQPRRQCAFRTTAAKCDENEQHQNTAAARKSHLHTRHNAGLRNDRLLS